MKRIPIVMYHKIGWPKKGQRYRNLSVNPLKFARQVRWLKDRGYSTVTFEQWSSPAFPMPAKPVILTFDDGYADFYTAAFPVLRAAGFTATVFVVAGLAGKTNEWSRGRNDVEEPLLTWGQILELQGAGVEFGCHTMTHASLNNPSLSQLVAEVTMSRRCLEEKLGRPVPVFAWPGGVGADEPAQRIFLRDQGFRFACRAGGGVESRPPRDPLGLRRVSIGERHGLLAFVWRTKTL